MMENNKPNPTVTWIAAYPHAAYPHVGYPHAAYPHVGYPHAAYPPAAYPHAAYPPATYPHAAYPPAAYPHVAHPQAVRPDEGLVSEFDTGNNSNMKGKQSSGNIKGVPPNTSGPFVCRTGNNYNNGDSQNSGNIEFGNDGSGAP